MKRPLILCILDGWGIGNGDASDAITHADKPSYDDLLRNSSSTQLEASGESVGLPNGQMGNSEVGHMTIGSGRIILQDLLRINQAINSGELKHNKVLNHFVKQVQIQPQCCVHLFGLLSDGGIHSHQNHIHALIDEIFQRNLIINIHVILDGRDTPPQNALLYIERLLLFIKDKPLVKIVSLCGRFYAMDRDNRWDRIEKAYHAMQADGTPFEDPIAYINKFYQQGVGDEFIPPAFAEGYSGLKDNDALICGNFRADRVRQLLTALIDPTFENFERTKFVKWTAVIGFTPYSQKLLPFITPMFVTEKVTHTLGEVISNHTLKQLRIAETEKYAHITYFFNAHHEAPYRGEERILVQSPKVTTYDLKPEMSAPEITMHIERIVHENIFDIIIVNYANADMVGHTGDFNAATQAIEILDKSINQLRKIIDQYQSILIITADHGNADCMYNSEKQHAHTAHTQNQVPFIIYHPGHHYNLTAGGNLSNIAPTVLSLLNIPIPKEMTATSLIEPDL